MEQTITGTHFTDDNGNPAGGVTQGTGILISWQNGPLGTGPDRVPPNGAFVEGVLVAALDRLEHYQESAFACDENAEAIRHIKDALAACNKRTQRRVSRGVEGTHTV